MRCAIYTRKSSEEGLEQEFNSLHAQREACEAFIKSQRQEGWTALNQNYDDGGYSGGTIERPALQALLADIEAGKVDIVVVYKVDRLTRALSDFAKIVELFDAHRVSFVSVTQQFNTTTSMGRLTLNVLLSFAQFEREVTGERIRDKIAASKKKGLWMGGNVPMGYDAKDRKLIIDERHAQTVRELYRLCIEKGSTRAVAEEAARRGYLTPKRVTMGGECRGGRPFSKGHIDLILTNRIYLGEIPHKDKSCPGEHEAIIDRETWNTAQEIRRRNGVAHRRKANVKHPSLLAGLLFDPDGVPMTPTHGGKNGKRYRYYASRSLITGEGNRENGRPIRVPASDIERITLRTVIRWLENESAVLDTLGSDLMNGQALEIPDRAAQFGRRLKDISDGERVEAIGELIERIDAKSEHIVIRINVNALSRALDGVPLREPDTTVTLEAPAKLVRIGGETRLVTPEDQTQPRGEPDPAIIRILARAHDWADQLLTGRVRSIADIAAVEGITPRLVARLLPLGFLAPEHVEKLVAGQHSRAITAEMLTRDCEIERCWADQRARLNL